MKKALAAVFTFFVCSINPNAAFTQDDAIRYVPSCGGPFDKCGFVRMDGSGRKEEIIPKKYEAALEFSEGLAGVRIKGRWGFINMKGDIVIAPKFGGVKSFANDLAPVFIDGKFGIINRRGDLVVKPQFSQVKPFSKNVVIASQGNVKFEGLYSVKSGWFGKSHWITKPEWEFSVFDRTGKLDLIWARKYQATGRGLPYGLMRPDGSWQVKPRYDHVQALSDERAVVSEQKLTGAVDPEGNLVVPLRPWGLSYWHNGFGLTRDPATGKTGLLDKSGNLVGGRFFDDASRGKNGLGEVLIDGVWHGIDQQGNIVAHPKENEVVKECPSGLKLVNISGKLQIIDQSGKPAVPFLLDRMSTLSGFECNKINSINYNGKMGYIDRNGRLLFDPPEFDFQYDFADGYAAVMKNKKWGIINEQGHFTVEPTYDTLRPAGNDIFKVTLAGKGFWVNNAGVEQAEPADQKQDENEQASYLACPGGLKIIPNNAEGDLWGMADEQNNVIVKPAYRAIHCFQQGVAWVSNDAKRQWCPVDSNGNLQDYPKCVAFRYPYELSHHYPEQLADDPYESSVLWSRAFLEFGAGLREEPPKME